MSHPLKNFIFYGSSLFSITVLDGLIQHGFKPVLIVTVPDAVSGRKKEIKKPEAKIWGEKHGVPVIQPVKLDSSVAQNLASINAGTAVVASYGKIIPKNIKGAKGTVCAIFIFIMHMPCIFSICSLVNPSASSSMKLFSSKPVFGRFI